MSANEQNEPRAQRGGAAAVVADVVFVAGCALVTVGLWQVYVPAAYIVAGLLLAIIALRIRTT